MALAPIETLEEFLESNPVGEHSHRVYINRVPVPGPRGPAGPPGAPGGPTGSKNVKSFGAIGDGLTNDTAAIKAAITAAALSNSIRMVFFPPGIYLIDDSLAIPPGIAFEGSGRMRTYLQALKSNISLISYMAGSLQNDFQIRGMGFLAGVYTDVIGITLDGVDSTKRLSLINMEDLYFNTRTGVYLKFCANVTMSNCFANACTDGFWFDNVADATLINLQAQNGSGYGFLIQGGVGAFDEGMKLVACSTNGQGFALYVSGQDWGQAIGCSFTTCATGGVAFVSARNWRLSDSDIATAADVAGIVVDSGCSDIQISENFIALNSYGIANLGGTRIGIRGNHFEANTGIDIYTTGTKSPIMGNACNSIGNAASILEALTADYNAITGNTGNGTITKIGANSVLSANISY